MPNGLMRFRNFNQDDELTGESFDPNGNVTTSGGKTFTYNTENQLVSMNGGAVRIVYDGDGNRVSKTVGATTTQYLVDDLNPTGYPQVVEELVGGAVSRTYTYGLQRISQNQVISNNWTPSFYGYDGFGTVRQLTSYPSGAITDTYDFDAFGNEVHSTGTTPNVYLYRGEQYDSDLGLYYLRARYYNPATGRFMSRDPEGGFLSAPSTLHRYLYAAADPIDWRDPSGRTIIEDTLIISKRSLGGVQYANTIGCFANILLVAGADELNGWTQAGIVGATYGCVSSFIWPGGKTWLAVKTTIDVGLCGLGLIQIANDFSQELQGQKVTNKAFLLDATGGVLGCAVTHLGKVLEGGD